MAPLIRDVHTVTAGDLQDLHDARVLALRIRGFVPADQAWYQAGRLIDHPSFSVYRNTAELMRVGISHWETHDERGAIDHAALDDYLASVEGLMGDIRRACLPYASPLDELWKSLDAEIGITRATINDRPMFAGVVRIFPQGSQLLPHNDILARDAPGLALAGELDAQFAANIYLETPSRGGDLQLWDFRPAEEMLRECAAEGSAYGADRDRVGPPALEFAVGTGDLVIIDATRLHAVSVLENGRRIGMSCFLGRRPAGPMIYWS